MKRLVRILASVAPLLAACGDDTSGTASTGTGETSASSSASTSEGTSASTSEGTSVGGSSSSSSATATGTSSGSDGSSSGTSIAEGSSSTAADSSSSGAGSTTGGAAALQVEVTDAMGFMDCMPIVAPDPLGLTFDLAFDNQGAAVTSADVTGARLLDGGVEIVSFDVSPASFGPFDAGEMTTVAASKLADSLSPANGCGDVQCNHMYDVEVTLDADGLVAVGTGTVTIACVF